MTSNTRMSTRLTRIALCQMTAVYDKEVNINVVKDMICQASRMKADMVFLPESCDFIPENPGSVLAKAESILNGSTIMAYRRLAANYKVWLSVGGIHEKSMDHDEKVYKTHLIIDNMGTIVQTYRKLHVKQTHYVAKGSHIVTPVNTSVGKVGLGISYDVKFPDQSAHLAMLGAEILTFPSAFRRDTEAAHWKSLLCARAIDNQCFVVAAAQAGRNNRYRESNGHSMVVDPWGVILADCGNESPCVRVININLEFLHHVRHHFSNIMDRRVDVYSQYACCLRKRMLIEHVEPDMRCQEQARAALVGRTYTFGHVQVPECYVFMYTQYSFAFVNIRCVVPGHVLVAPLRKVLRNEHLTEPEASDFFFVIRIVQKLVERVYAATSCTINIQDGVDAGQTVKHLHCHVMPRKPGDFVQNDLIYLELAKHDMPDRPIRSVREMGDEAALLRRQLAQMQL